MISFSKVGTIFAALALAGCETSTEVTSNPIPLNQIQIGRASADIVFTPILFGDICIDHAPSFAGTPAHLAGTGLFQQASTGTYYHTNLNLSVKLLERNGKSVCSMVFGSRENPLQLSIVMQTQSAQSVLTEFIPVGTGPGGMPMYRMTAQAK